MSQNDNRVLCRQGARELTIVETEVVNGAFAHTDLCSTIRYNPVAQTTSSPDSDGCDHT